jgi:hypothetical protein
VSEVVVLVGLDTGVPFGKNTGVDNCIVKSSIQYLWSGGYTTSLGCITASRINTPAWNFAGNVMGKDSAWSTRKNIRVYPSPGAIYL